MQQQPASTLDATQSLYAESLRLTAFLAPAEPIVHTNWWAELTGTEPESRSSKPGRGESQDSGPCGEGTLVLSIQPGRIDWLITAQLESEFQGTPRFAGRLAETTATFSDLMLKWLISAPPIIRLGYGVTVHQPVDNKIEAYSLLSKLLPTVQIDTQNSEDFIYQINRPILSKVIPELKINRIGKWSAAMFFGVRLDLTKVALQQQTTGRVFSCRMEFDVNTDGANTAPFAQEKNSPLLAELRDIAFDLASKGDRP